MAEPSGPFKIILQQLALASPDMLGNPAAERVGAELARLFNLDDQMAGSIRQAMPIIILDGLSAVVAGTVRERLRGLANAGCKVVVTDEPSDTIPRVNWPELPAVAHVAEDRESRRESTPHQNGRAALLCPSCGAGFHLVPAHGAPRHAEARGDVGRGSASGERALFDRSDASGERRAAALPAERHPTPPRSDPRAVDHHHRAPETPASASSRALAPPDDDDWLNPPVGDAMPARAADPPPGSGERPSSRFDDAALLAFRRAEASPPPPAPAPPEELEVAFSDSGVGQIPGEFLRGRSAPAPTPAPIPPSDARRPLSEATPARSVDPFDEPFDGADAFDNSSSGAGAPLDRLSAFDASDPFDRPDGFGGSSLDAPLVRSDARPAETGSARRSTVESVRLREEDRAALEDSGSDILDVDPPHRRSAGASKPSTGSVFEDDLGLLDDPPSNERRPNLDELDMLEDSDELPAPARHVDAVARRDRSDEVPARGRAAQKSPDDDLDAVLRMFGPEDARPLDDMGGLEPQPLDLSPRGGGRSAAPPAAAPARGRGPSLEDDELSDILEPLNPSEAMEIIKSQKDRQRGRASSMGGPTGGLEAFESDEADSLDIFAESRGPTPIARNKKKTRGVPFSASDEDLSLFEDSRGPSRQKTPPPRSTDPFARARRAADEDERPESRPATRGGTKRTSSRRAAKARSEAPASTPKSGSGKSPGRTSCAGGGGGGAAPTGDGEHGLVLSRISDPEKKDKAAELIAEIRGCSIDSAQRLTDRTIIPVLKGVSREVAEFHLDKFRRYKIAGRVTTRQRS